MTYDELMEALQNKTLTSFSILYYTETNLYKGYTNTVYFGSSAPGIMIEWNLNNGNNSGTLQFSSDNTITEFAGPV